MKYDITIKTVPAADMLTQESLESDAVFAARKIEMTDRVNLLLLIKTGDDNPQASQIVSDDMDKDADKSALIEAMLKAVSDLICNREHDLRKTIPIDFGPRTVPPTLGQN